MLAYTCWGVHMGGAARRERKARRMHTKAPVDARPESVRSMGSAFQHGHTHKCAPRFSHPLTPFAAPESEVYSDICI